MKRLLRILHLSDVHFGPNNIKAAPNYRRLLRAAFRSPLVSKKVLQGVSPHDPTALRELSASVISEAADAEWLGKTVLICTGDLSTWGDEPSVVAVKRLLDRLAADAGLPDPVVLYGNHDVWPAKPWQIHGYPLFALPWTLKKRRADLRFQHFPKPGPIDHSGNLQVRCFAINTVQHERLENAFALGKVQHDYYWDPTNRSTHSQEAAVASKLGTGEIGIALTHHPVYDPEHAHHATGRQSAPPTHTALVNAQQVAASLRGCAAGGRIHVFISGHVHQIIPELGKLDAKVLGQQPPLDSVQLQLCVGTAAQDCAPGVTQDQSWQQIRVYLDGDDDCDLVIERIVHQRDQCFGAFERYADDVTPTDTAEVLVMPRH